MYMITFLLQQNSYKTNAYGPKIAPTGSLVWRPSSKEKLDKIVVLVKKERKEK